MGNLVWWEGVRVIHTGKFRICWCEPRNHCDTTSADLSPQNCCTSDASFDEDMGCLRVHGPDTQPPLEPIIGQQFDLRLQGTEIGYSSSILVRLRHSAEPYPCGEARTNREVEDVQVEKGNDVFGHFKVKVFRRLQYVVCWCPGEPHAGSFGWFHPSKGACSSDFDFGAEVGLIFPRGPNTENLLFPSAIVAVPFRLELRGDGFQEGDRVRVTSMSSACGREGTINDASMLFYVCGRGELQCVTNPIAWENPPKEIAPGTPRNSKFWLDVADDSESWEPVIVDKRGLYRICWCQDTTWDSRLLISVAGHCGRPEDFSTQAGILKLEGVNDTQESFCQAFAECEITVRSSLPVSASDEILIIPGQKKSRARVAICGRGALGVRVQASLHSNESSFEVVEAFADVGLTRDANLSLRAHGLDQDQWTHRDQYRGIFTVDQVGPAGVFAICYCHRASLDGPCDDPAVFGQFAGTLYVSTAAENADENNANAGEPYWYPAKVCNSFEQCQIKFSGLWAAQVESIDAFVAVPASANCGSEAEPLPIVFSLLSKKPSTTDWKVTFATPAGQHYEVGDYKVCFCSASESPKGQICTRPSQFAVFAGELWVVGIKKKQSWTCTQGRPCKLLLPTYRGSLGDKLVLADAGSECAIRGRKSVEMAVGFRPHPFEPVATPITADSHVTFDLNHVNGAGRWKLCLCPGASWSAPWWGGNGVCGSSDEFVQDAGDLLVEGAIARMYEMYSLPSTRNIVTVVVEMALVGDLACAVASHELSTAPKRDEVLDCQRIIPGCLGSGSLPEAARRGPNVVHVPIATSGVYPASDNDSLSQAHVWCVGDEEYCPNGRCSMPGNGVGFLVHLMAGVEPWTEWLTGQNHAFDLELRGNPLNGEGGFLELVPTWATCGDSKDAVKMGSADVIRIGESAVWKDVLLKKPGFTHVCWCDRPWGFRCVGWQLVGRIGVSGPVRASSPPAPPSLGTLVPFEIQVSGVNLSMSNRLAIVSGDIDACENVDVVTGVFAPTSANKTAVLWFVIAPATPGSFTVCWGFEANSFSAVVTRGVAFSRTDCQVNETWWPVLDTSGDVACSRSCSGGDATWRQSVLHGPEGGGTVCPGEEERMQTRPCNTQRCPVARAFWAWTEPRVIYNATDFNVIVEGHHFDPNEDFVAIVGSDRACGTDLTSSGMENVGFDIDVHDCRDERSSSTLLLCGPFNLEDAGFYSVCVCDASEVDSSVGYESRCDVLEQFGLELDSANSTSIEIVELFGGSSSEGATGENGRGPTAGDSRLRSADGISAAFNADSVFWISGWVSAVMILPTVVAITVAGRYYLHLRPRDDSRSYKIHAKIPEKTVNEELVEKATREAWNAFRRTMDEHMDPEKFNESSCEVEPNDMPCSPCVMSDVQSVVETLATTFSRSNTGSRCSTGDSSSGTECQSRIEDYRQDSVANPVGRPTSRPESGPSFHIASRSTTPPLSAHSRRYVTPAATPPVSSYSRITTGATPPVSSCSHKSIDSRRPSLLRVELQKEVAVSPQQGGCFLDLPLEGRSAPPPVGRNSKVLAPPGAQSQGQVIPIPSGQCPSSRPSSSGVSSLGKVPMPKNTPCLLVPLVLPSSVAESSAIEPERQGVAAYGDVPTAVSETLNKAAQMEDELAPHASSTARPPGDATDRPFMPDVPDPRPPPPELLEPLVPHTGRPPGDGLSEMLGERIMVPQMPEAIPPPVELLEQLHPQAKPCGECILEAFTERASAPHLPEPPPPPKLPPPSECAAKRFSGKLPGWPQRQKTSIQISSLGGFGPGLGVPSPPPALESVEDSGSRRKISIPVPDLPPPPPPMIPKQARQNSQLCAPAPTKNAPPPKLPCPAKIQSTEPLEIQASTPQQEKEKSNYSAQGSSEQASVPSLLPPKELPTSSSGSEKAEKQSQLEEGVNVDCGGGNPELVFTPSPNGPVKILDYSDLGPATSEGPETPLQSKLLSAITSEGEEVPMQSPSHPSSPGLSFGDRSTDVTGPVFLVQNADDQSSSSGTKCGRSALAGRLQAMRARLPTAKAECERPAMLEAALYGVPDSVPRGPADCTARERARAAAISKKAMLQEPSQTPPVTATCETPSDFVPTAVPDEPVSCTEQARAPSNSSNALEDGNCDLMQSLEFKAANPGDTQERLQAQWYSRLTAVPQQMMAESQTRQKPRPGATLGSVAARRRKVAPAPKASPTVAEGSEESSSWRQQKKATRRGDAESDVGSTHSEGQRWYLQP